MALLDDAVAMAKSVPVLAIFPFVSTLLAYQKLLATGSAPPGGGFKLPMPTALPNLWTFVSAPNTGVTLKLGVPLEGAPVFFLVEAALVAGFVGSIDDAIDGQSLAFLDHVAAHTLPVLLVHLVTFALSLAAFAIVFAGGLTLAPIATVLTLVVGYLLWAAPILVVIRDHGAVTALAESVTLALQGGRYTLFSLIYLLGGVATSLVLSVGVRGRFLVLLVTAVVLAFPLLIVAVATVQVVRSLLTVDDETIGDTADDDPAINASS